MRILETTILVMLLAGTVMASGEPTERGQRDIASKLHNIQSSINANTKAIEDLNRTLARILQILERDERQRQWKKND